MNTSKLLIFTVLLFPFSTFPNISFRSKVFNNAGTFRAPNINVSAETTLRNDGVFIATEKITLKAGETIEGTGLIQAPLIEILTKKFAFTGTIDCSGKCTIQTEEPVDTATFTSKGGGEFVIPNQKTLVSTIVAYCYWKLGLQK